MAWYSWMNQPQTWVGHALVAWLAALLPAIALGWPLSVGGFGAAIFYLVREHRDAKRHKAAGDWRTPEADSTVTPLADKAGDSLGPVTVFITALTADIYYIASCWCWGW